MVIGLNGSELMASCRALIIQKRTLWEPMVL